MRRFAVLPALVFGLAMLSGCSSGPVLGQVKGKVYLDDKPLKKGTIVFETPGQRPATAEIEDGEIVNAVTYKPGDGVPVGMHKVAIAATTEPATAVVPNPGQAGKSPAADYMSGKSLLPTRYNDPATSTLTAEIKPGENVLEFKLSSK